MSYPSIEGLKLEPCCHEALEQIQDKIKLGKALQVALSGGLFVTLLAGRGRYVSEASTVYNIATTDWDLFGKAVKAVPAIVKNRCRQICGFECLNHSGGDLNKFWRGMERSFW